MNETDIIRIDRQEIESVLYKLFLRYGASESNARLSAINHTQNSVDGVPSHGLDRVTRTIDYIERGYIDPKATCTKVSEGGATQVLDGNLGFGNVNAIYAMDSACDLAEVNGIGVVSVRNTNHWMRGGAYGWQAADRGYVGMCWSNTRPNMVPWGGSESVIGNNPFVLSVPRNNGQHVVVDCAMSQFSFGKIQNALNSGERLSFPGGWNEDGELTDEPYEIMKTKKSVPMGYWKGSGLSIALDLIGASLSGGYTVTQISQNCSEETALTQVMIAIKPDSAYAYTGFVEGVLRSVADSSDGDVKVRYPGQREYSARQENLIRGVPVSQKTWRAICSI